MFETKEKMAMRELEQRKQIQVRKSEIKKEYHQRREN